MPLHEMMHTFKLKSDLMEKISAVRQGPKWKPNMTLRIAESKEQAKEEEGADESRMKVFTDGSGYEGQVGAAAVLYRDGVVRGRRRMRLGSLRHHTVYEGEGVGMILGLDSGADQRRATCKRDDTDGSRQHGSHHCNALNQTRAGTLSVGLVPPAAKNGV
jgi:hypothetical protein